MNFLDQLLLPYKFYCKGHVRNTLFHFYQLWAVYLNLRQLFTYIWIHNMEKSVSNNKMSNKE